MVVATTLNYLIALSVLLGYPSFFPEILSFLQSLPWPNPHLDVLFILQVTLGHFSRSPHLGAEQTWSMSHKTR